jgi:hypothetical protein
MEVVLKWSGIEEGRCLPGLCRVGAGEIEGPSVTHNLRRASARAGVGMGSDTVKVLDIAAS